MRGMGWVAWAPNGPIAFVWPRQWWILTCYWSHDNGCCNPAKNCTISNFYLQLVYFTSVIWLNWVSRMLWWLVKRSWKNLLSSGSRSMITCKQRDDNAKCLVVIVLIPTTWTAPAPNTSWLVRLLKNYTIINSISLFTVCCRFNLP